MNLLNKSDNKIAVNNNKRFLNLLADTSTHSNNGYRGEGTIHLYQLDHRNNKANFGCPYRNWNITYLIQHINPYAENWFTVNAVKGLNRSQAQVVGYNALYVDVDVMKDYLKHHDAVLTDKLRQSVLMTRFGQIILLAKEHKIMKPNAIVMTGNGFHIYWLFTHQSTDHMIGTDHDVPANEWKDLEEYIFNQISRYVSGCDHSATDNKRILRMPGSNNTKQYAKTGDSQDLIPVQVWYFNPNRHTIDFYLKKYHQHEHQNDLKQTKNHFSANVVNAVNKHTYSHKSQALLHFADSLYAASGLFNNDGRRENILFYYTVLIMNANAYSVKHNYTSAKSVKGDVMRCLRAMNKRFGHHGTRLSDDEIETKLFKRIRISKFNTSNSKKDKKNHDIAHYYITKKDILKGCNFSTHEQIYLRYLRSSNVQRHCTKIARYNKRMEAKEANKGEMRKQFMFKLSLGSKAVYLHSHKHVSYRKLVKVINRSIFNKIMSRHSHHYSDKQLAKKQISLSTLRRLMKLVYKYTQHTNILNDNQLATLGNQYVQAVSQEIKMSNESWNLIKQANSWNHYNSTLTSIQENAVNKLAQTA